MKQKWKAILWHIVLALAQRAVPLLVGAILGLLADTQFLDGQLALELERLLGQYASRSCQLHPIPWLDQK